MSSLAKQLFTELKSLAPGLSNIGPELGAELSRQVTQGRNELAAALYTGNAFVLYGEGQRTPDVTSPDFAGPAIDESSSVSHAHESDGREM